jgi:hypothetical protein
VSIFDGSPATPFTVSLTHNLILKNCEILIAPIFLRDRGAPHADIAVYFRGIAAKDFPTPIAFVNACLITHQSITILFHVQHLSVKTLQNQFHF